MTSFSVVTIEQLFGLSGNHCAFPGCEQVLVDPEWLDVKGEICHICAAIPNGPRYDASMTKEDRYAFANLILLCPTHHVVIDRLEPHLYTATVLRDMKARAEDQAMFGERAMREKLTEKDVNYVERAVAQFIVASNRYYSFPPVPPMTSPAYLEGAATVEAKADVSFGGLRVGAERSVVGDSARTSGAESTFTASMGGPGEEVTTVGGPGASVEHEVVRGTHDELVVDDSAGTAYGGRHASDESLNKDSVHRATDPELPNGTH